MEQPGLVERIWQVVAAIPPGHVMSYGQVARQAGYPNHARFVGRVLRMLPEDSQLPWFRVITAQGRLAFAPDTDAWWRQRTLLEAEGVPFINDRIPARYQVRQLL
ncbi:MGMT family protein [Marinobacterium litorale]|uniref:MGMT family protein n=1 Tax=Marinobacterium litorale TaxID=404770 RepID=UPI0004165AB0|nr:MGMT family protein [Marinobacterium litorale]